MKTGRIGITASSLLALLSIRASAEQGGPLTLATGQAVERELAAGQTHTYAIALGTGDFLHAVVLQRGIDVVVELRGPDGRTVIEEDSPLGASQTEWVTYESRAAGAYTLVIRPVEKDATPGRYAIELQERRQKAPGDEPRISAEALFLDANAAFAKGTPDSFREALGKFEGALALYAQAGRRVEEAVAHNCAVQAARQLSDNSTALRHSEHALAIYRGLNDMDGQSATAGTLGTLQYFAGKYAEARATLEAALGADRAVRSRVAEARTLTWLGYADQKLQQDADALQCFEQALAIRRDLGDKRGQADSLDDLGFDHWLNSRFDQAVPSYERALSLRRDLHDRAGEAKVLERLGYAYANTKQLAKGVEAYEQSIAIKRELKDRQGEVGTRADLAFAYWLNDDYQHALEHYEPVLALQRESGDQAGEIRTLDRMAFAYRKLSRYDDSLLSLEKLLGIHRERQDAAGELSALNDIAFTYQQAERYDKSAEYYSHVLAMREAIGDRAGQAQALMFLGEARRQLHDYSKAVDCYQQAIAIRRELKDRSGEASAMGSLAFVYSDTRDYDRASELYGQALTIRRGLKDRSGEASTLEGIALVNESTGENERARSLFEQALAIRRELGDKPNEVSDLRALARLYSEGSNERATATLEEALAIQRATGDRRGEGKTLTVLGLIEAKAGRYDRELAYYNQALAIARETGARTDEGLASMALGQTYFRLGLHDHAMPLFEQALAIGRTASNRTLEAMGHYTLGVLAAIQGRYEPALESLDAALALARAGGDRNIEVNVLGFQALVYTRLGRVEPAQRAVEQGLAIAGETRNRMAETQALMSQSMLLALSGQRDRAAAALQRALSLAQQLQFREVEGEIFYGLMTLLAPQQPRLAVVFGKKSIDIIQEIRNDVPNLDQTLRQAFMDARKSRFRELADLLAAQGRLAEAQQVLDLQKGDEFRTFVMRDRTVAPEAGRVTLTPEEAEWEKRYTEIADRLTSIGAQRRALLEKPDRTADDEKALAALESDLEAGNRAFQNFLNNVGGVLGDRKSATDQVSRVREAEGLMETLRDLGPGSVAVYTIVGDSGFRSILITPDVEKGYSYPISAANLNKKILAFRELLRNPVSDPRPAARELYDVLVRPMEKDLEGVHAETIMWSLDGALRYMPVAALYDGEHYLVERFRNVVFTPASQSRLKDPVSHDWRGLGVGVSLAHENFEALPNVPGELNAIISSGGEEPKGVLPGTVALDGDFTKDGFRSALRNHYSIVHVASHFSFSPGRDRDSFLLMGDGSKLTLEEFRSMPQVLQGVELLTLSACETAVGGEDADGKEIEGLAVLAQRQGAKAVVATLWSVADESTALLMREFYRLRTSDQSMTKAEALRQAQIALLTGRLRGGVAAARGVRTNPSASTPAFKSDPDRPYAHPYFWAPFLLMGNWK
jgi:CHAT domain-containing protein/uncharacterized protein HemY